MYYERIMPSKNEYCNLQKEFSKITITLKMIVGSIFYENWILLDRIILTHICSRYVTHFNIANNTPKNERMNHSFCISIHLNGILTLHHYFNPSKYDKLIYINPHTS